MRPVYTVNLWREHQYREPSVWRDVGEIVLYSILAGLVCVIWLVGVMR